MKIVKRLGIILGIILILLTIGFFLIGNYFYNFALNTATSKDLVMESNASTTDEEEKVASSEKEKKRNQEWLEEKSKDVYITSKDDLKLHGYQIKNTEETNKWMIVIHGYVSEGKNMVSYAKRFQELGYHVLMVDLRGHGLSQGDYVGMGWPDRLDIVEWINYLVKENANCKIGLFGISMGAATVMMTTGEDLPDNVKVAIEDCGYSSVWDEFAQQLDKIFHLPTFPALDAANIVTKIRANYSFKEASSVEQVKKSKTPTLFIHGDKDDFVPFSMLEEVYQAANIEKQKLVVTGAGHAESADVNPEKYWNAVEQFLKKQFDEEK